MKLTGMLKDVGDRVQGGVEKLYIPVFVGTNHFIACLVDFQAFTISYGELNSRKPLQLKTYLRRLPPDRRLSPICEFTKRIPERASALAWASISQQVYCLGECPCTWSSEGRDLLRFLRCKHHWTRRVARLYSSMDTETSCGKSFSLLPRPYKDYGTYSVNPPTP